MFDTSLNLVIRRDTQAAGGNVHPRCRIAQNPERRVQGPLGTPNLKYVHAFGSSVFIIAVKRVLYRLPVSSIRRCLGGVARR